MSAQARTTDALRRVSNQLCIELGKAQARRHEQELIVREMLEEELRLERDIRMLGHARQDLDTHLMIPVKSCPESAAFKHVVMPLAPGDMLPRVTSSKHTAHAWTVDRTTVWCPGLEA